MPVSAQAAVTLVVANTDDSGAGSLRQAILDANANAGLPQAYFTVAPPPLPFRIQYQPAKKGAHRHDLKVRSNDPRAPLAAVKLSGKASSVPGR